MAFAYVWCTIRRLNNEFQNITQRYRQLQQPLILRDCRWVGQIDIWIDRRQMLRWKCINIQSHNDHNTTVAHHFVNHLTCTKGVEEKFAVGETSRANELSSIKEVELQYITLNYLACLLCCGNNKIDDCTQ